MLFRSARGGASASGMRSRRRGYTLVEILLALTILGVLIALAMVSYTSYRERADLARAVADIAVLSASMTEFRNEYGRFPTDLAEVGADRMRDPWGNAYQYIDHTDSTKSGHWRKDKNIHPINSDFDLYSMGKDGASVAPLTAKPSRDDIIRANDGAFIGLASKYDP